MSSYTVARNQHSHGFRVDIVTGNGTRHTLPGFGTENEALQWIEADKRREHWMQSSNLLSDDAD